MAYSGSTAVILSNYDEYLKTFYLPAIQDYLNHDTILSDKIDTNEKDVSGKNATVLCRYGRSAGFGARKDGGALPEADYQKSKTCTVPMKYNYGRVTFSGPTIAATRDEMGAYTRVIETEIAGIVRDVQKDINRQLWGAGYGLLARLGGGIDIPTSGTTQYLQRKYTNNSYGGNAFGSTFGSKYIDDFLKSGTTNGAFQVVTPTLSSGWTAATLDGTSFNISAATQSADGTYVTVTLGEDPNPSPAENDGAFIVRAGNFTSLTNGSAAGLGRHEMMGLRGIVTNTNLDDITFDDGGPDASDNVGFASASAPTEDSLQGLSVDTYSWFKAIVDEHESGRYNGQRALTTKLMQKMFDRVEENAGKDYGPDMIITTNAIRREYLEIMQSDRRHVNTMQLDGGWTALDYNGIPLITDDDAIDGEMYFSPSKICSFIG